MNIINGWNICFKLHRSVTVWAKKNFSDWITTSLQIYRINSIIDVAAVAYDALPYLSLRPESTIFNAKRFIGGDLNNSATLSYATAHPYRVVPSTLSKHSKVGFELTGEDSLSTVITPENVGSEVRSGCSM